MLGENGNCSGVVTVMTIRFSSFHSARNVPTFQRDLTPNVGVILNHIVAPCIFVDSLTFINQRMHI